MSEGEVKLPKLISRDEKVELWFYFLYFGLGLIGTALVGLIFDSIRASQPASSHYAFLIVAISTDILALLFIVWLMKRDIGDFGLRKFGGLAFPLVVIGVAVVFMIVSELISAPLRSGFLFNGMTGPPWIGYGAPRSLLATPIALTFALTYTLMSAFYQEFVFRGVLLARMTEIFGSTNKAVLVSSIMFSLMHVYQGIYVLPGHFLFAVSLCWMYLRCKSLWPLVIGHFLVNGVFLVQQFNATQRLLHL